MISSCPRSVSAPLALEGGLVSPWRAEPGGSLTHPDGWVARGAPVSPAGLSAAAQLSSFCPLKRGTELRHSQAGCGSHRAPLRFPLARSDWRLGLLGVAACCRVTGAGQGPPQPSFHLHPSRQKPPLRRQPDVTLCASRASPQARPTRDFRAFTWSCFFVKSPDSVVHVAWDGGVTPPGPVSSSVKWWSWGG